MYGLILAGGSGSRLWPLSRELYPKQFLNIQNTESLLQLTFERLSTFILPSNIISTTGVKHFSNVKYQLSKLTDSPIVLSEPISKNTAPAIAIGSKYILDNFGEDAIILAVPSDHLINDIDAFKNAVNEGEKIAQEGYIVTFGVKPSYVETGYGYINIKNEKIKNGFAVNKFTEKPDNKLAEEYIKDPNYLWNSGIFMFKVSTFLNELQNTNKEISCICCADKPSVFQQ